MRQMMVAGNWKMTNFVADAVSLAEGLKALVSGVDTVDIAVCPTYTSLYAVGKVLAGSTIQLGAQDAYVKASGAYTGEISASMLHSMGMSHCILGHSERRTYFGETDKVIATKIDLALKHGITPIYCCGEVLAERQAEKHFDVVKTQVSEALFHLGNEAIKEVVIAYEPVWAIGTGVTASSDQAQEMHGFIRSLLTEKYGSEVSAEISILYGGSCNAKNAAELFANPDVDGGLIGGASLKAADFVTIVNSFA